MVSNRVRLRFRFKHRLRFYRYLRLCSTTMRPCGLYVRVRNPEAPPISAATGDLMSSRRAALRDGGRNTAVYRDLNRAVRSAIRRDTRDSIEERIRESGPRSAWQSIRSVVGGKRSGTPVLPQLSSEELNHFFVSGTGDVSPGSVLAVLQYHLSTSTLWLPCC